MSPILHVRPLLRPWKRNLSTFATWPSLLFPSAQDTHMVLPKLLQINETPEGVDHYTSSFAPQEWTSQRLPSRLHLAKDLQYKMHQDLCHIINEHCHIRAENLTKTPRDSFSYFRRSLERIRHVTKGNVTMMANHVSYLVYDIHYVLTGEDVDLDTEERTDHNIVYTDQVYRCRSDDIVKILWDNKLLTEFNQLVGELMDDLRHGSKLEAYPQMFPTKYEGYRATFGRVCVLFLSEVYYLIHVYSCLIMQRIFSLGLVGQSCSVDSSTSSFISLDRQKGLFFIAHQSWTFASTLVFHRNLGSRPNHLSGAS
jgi:hypothetical protein